MTRRHFMQMLGAVACAIAYPLKAVRGVKPPAIYAGIDYGSRDSTSVVTVTNIASGKITHISCDGELLVVDGIEIRAGDVLTVNYRCDHPDYLLQRM